VREFEVALKSRPPRRGALTHPQARPMPNLLATIMAELGAKHST